MIFLGNLNKISTIQWQVGLVHNMPFDEEHGIKDSNGNLLTEDQLNEIGLVVDSIPGENPPTGQITSAIYVNPQTKEVTYAYALPPKRSEDLISDLQAQNAQMLLALVTNGLM